jgi:hypothetical protein
VVGGKPVADELQQFGEFGGVAEVELKLGMIVTSGQLAFLLRLVVLLVRSR